MNVYRRIVQVRMRSRATIAAALVVTLGLLSGTSCEYTIGDGRLTYWFDLSGTVTDATTGQPIPSATVNAWGTVEDGWGSSTNEDGHDVFQVRAKDGSTLRLTAWADGYGPQAQDTIITLDWRWTPEGSAAIVTDFALRPPPQYLCPWTAQGIP